MRLNVLRSEGTKLNTVKARLNRRFLSHFQFRCNFCRARIAFSNPVCKLAAISVLFGRDFSRDVAEISNNLTPIFRKSKQIAADIAPESHRNHR